MIKFTLIIFCLNFPEADLTIKTTGSQLTIWTVLDALNAVLVLRGQSSCALILSQLIFVLENSERTLLSIRSSCFRLIEIFGENPSSALVFEKKRLATMTGSDNGSLTGPVKVHQRKIRKLDDLSLTRGTVGDIDNSQGRVLRNKSELVSRRSPLNVLNPTSRNICFKGVLSEWKTFSIRGILRSLISSLDEGRENTDLAVCGSSGNENITRVEVNSCHCRLVLLDVLTDPPVVLLLVVTDGHTFSTG
mmetsp:Transcript_1665/g.2250  ORF Transcript_1665/g.2250 Transcript_1665/m.2250 type:complete len:248 (-) Transcript_1665:522-1265(-)